MIDFYKKYLAKGQPLQHVFHHFIFANIGLFLTYLIFGSITVWEVVLFLFMTFFPITDQLIYAATSYLSDDDCRAIINLFLVGDLIQTTHLIHMKRSKFQGLILHNLTFYVTLSAFLFVTVAFDLPVLFYAIAGILIHLLYDLVNDEYELNTIGAWYWPLKGLNLNK